MGLGGVLATGNSKLFEGPLGVVQIFYKGYNLGKTTADSNLTPDQDIKDIVFQQDGTKPADNVRTGIEFILAATFGEIKTGLLVEMMKGITSENTDPNSDSGTIGRSIYQSMRNTEAGALKIAAVDGNGIAYESDENIMCWYEAIPIIEGDLMNWGADSQRNFPVSFKLKFHIFKAGESSSKFGAFGYWGDPIEEDVPAVDWPDVQAPTIVSSAVASTTVITSVFNKDVVFQGGSFGSGTAMADVDGVMKLAASASISGKTLTLNFSGGTFSSGNIVKLSISDKCIQDTETVPNECEGVYNYLTNNPL